MAAEFASLLHLMSHTIVMKEEKIYSVAILGLGTFLHSWWTRISRAVLVEADCVACESGFLINFGQKFETLKSEIHMPL